MNTGVFIWANFCVIFTIVHAVVLPDHCVDFVKNLDETDVDCGGSQCLPCAGSEECLVDSDCASGSCQMEAGALRCVGCEDGVLNGEESGIDCGGDCGACAVDERCKQFLQPSPDPLNGPKLYETHDEQASKALYHRSDVQLGSKLSHGHCKLYYAEGTQYSWFSDLTRSDYLPTLGQAIAGWIDETPHRNFNRYGIMCDGEITKSGGVYNIPDLECFVNLNIRADMVDAELLRYLFIDLVDFPRLANSIDNVYRRYQPNNTMNHVQCADHCKSKYTSDLYYMINGHCGCCHKITGRNDVVWQESDYELIDTFTSYPNGKYSDFTTYSMDIVTLSEYDGSCAVSSRVIKNQVTNLECNTLCNTNFPGSSSRNTNGCQCTKLNVYTIFGERPHQYNAQEEEIFEEKCLRHCRAQFPDSVGVELVHNQYCACNEFHTVVPPMTVQDAFELCSGTFYLDGDASFCCKNYDCDDLCSKTRLLDNGLYEYTCRSCNDGILNGGETDVDCGGPADTGCGQTCNASKICLSMLDCADGDCLNGTCVGCADGERNGDEIDVDCGGSCQGCKQGQRCETAQDCLAPNAYCDSNTCQSCDDTVQGPSEPITDKGQHCSEKINRGGACFVDEDCTSDYMCGLNSTCQECIHDGHCDYKCHDGSCFDNVPGTFIGTTCPEGTIDDDLDASTECVQCDAGYSSTAGSTACLVCPEGKQSIQGGTCKDLSCDAVGAVPPSPVCHGTCSIVQGKFECSDCTGQWYGPNCEYHAKCSQNEIFVNDSCVPCAVSSYGSLYCVEEGSACPGLPCLNGGKCVEEEGDWSCLCQPGTYGSVCQYTSNCVSAHVKRQVFTQDTTTTDTSYETSDNSTTTSTLATPEYTSEICDCADEYFGDHCEYSYICSADDVFTIDGCLPRCANATLSERFSCMCGSEKLDGQYCVDGVGYSFCTAGTTCFDTEKTYSHFVTSGARSIGGVQHYLAGCTANETAMNYVESATFEEVCVYRIKDCNVNEDCTFDEVCVDGLCRQNPCVDQWYNMTAKGCYNHTLCEKGTGSRITYHHDSVCEPCGIGEYNTGDTYYCRTHSDPCEEDQVQVNGTNSTDVVCHDKIDCDPPVYQVVDACEYCEGYVPSFATCVPFQTCDDNYYLQKPFDWNGTTDANCIPRKQCGENEIELKSNDQFEDSFCVLKTLDDCIHDGVHFINVSYEDRQQLFHGNLGASSAIIPLLLCQGKEPVFTLKNFTNSSKHVTVSNNIGSSGLYAFDFSVTAVGLCTTEMTNGNCAQVDINGTLRDACVSEFEPCGCANGCIHGICDGSVCTNCTFTNQRPDIFFTGQSCNEVQGCDLCEFGDCQGDLRSCECHDGYEGARCEKNIDDCFYANCGHGTCQDELLNYTCSCHDYAYFEVDECLYNCSFCEHGVCQESRCVCDDGYTGIHCNVSTCIEQCAFIEACVSDAQGNKVCKSGCEDSPCVHGNCTNKAGGAFSCSCEPGYEGERCENEINECNLNLCSNNATCIDKIADFECVCASGYNGTYCDHSLCENVDCNHGSCNNGACICDDTYTGQYCNVSVNECVQTPCGENSISCLDPNPGPNNFICTCDHYHEGDRCENPKQECLHSPCGIGGTCLDIDRGFQCTCESGYEVVSHPTMPYGTTCQNIDDCGPCEHGTCEDGINEYTCICDFGWQGKSCADNVDPCHGHLCYNGATCVPDGTDYTCDCAQGYEGQFCSANVDDCVGKCGVNGSFYDCVDLLNGYLCDCPSDMTFYNGECVCGLGRGFNGTYCEMCSAPTFNMDYDLSPCEFQICPDGHGIVKAHVFNITDNQTNCERCEDGYYSDGTHECRNENECRLGENPCGNGRCVDTDGGYRCECDSGFFEITGNGDAACVLEDPCSPNPCFTGFLCQPSLIVEDGYRCVCPEGWEGPKCQHSIDDCVNADCGHGTCIDGHLSYQCDCTDSGFTGNHCENNIDDCFPQACNKRGECIDAIKGYTCDCYGLWEGEFCDTKSKTRCPDGYTRIAEECKIQGNPFKETPENPNVPVKDPRNGREKGSPAAEFNIISALEAMVSEDKGSKSTKEFVNEKKLELTVDDLQVETKNVIKRNITKVFRSMAPKNTEVQPETITNWAEECHIDFSEVNPTELNVVESFPEVGSWVVACENNVPECMVKRQKYGYKLHQWVSNEFDKGRIVSKGDLVNCGRSSIIIGSMTVACPVDTVCVNAIGCEPDGNDFKCICAPGAGLIGNECLNNICDSVDPFIYIRFGCCSDAC